MARRDEYVRVVDNEVVVVSSVESQRPKKRRTIVSFSLPMVLTAPHYFSFFNF